MRKGIVVAIIFVVVISVTILAISFIHLSSKNHLEPIDVEKKSSENVSRPHIPPEELKRVVFEGTLINIALTDTRVREEIGNWSYEIGGIEYMDYEERNGELKIKGNFPVLPIHLGNKNEPGVTLLVFINPDDESVIGIGYDYRRNS